MIDKYILNGKIPVKCDDLIAWGRWFEDTDKRTVCHDDIGDVVVSTVFIGLNHNWDPNGPPLLFETMIFGGPDDQYQERYSTWEEAEEGHRLAVDIVKNNITSKS